MLLLPSLGSKFKLEIVPGEKTSGSHLYADLNEDSISERILTGKSIPYYYITVQNADYLYYDQWNIRDSLNTYISGIFFGDYDHDRNKEIYVFSSRRDSLFLNINEILEPSGTKMNRVFITKIGYLNGEVAATLFPAGFYDENGDGRDELYFSISSFFQLGPRRLYYYNLVDRHLEISKPGASALLSPEMFDADGDGKPEIFGKMAASGNYRSNVPLSDSSGWLMVFDERLNFEFPPVEFPGFANMLNTLSYNNGSFKGYVVSLERKGADTALQKSKIMIFSKDGQLMRSRFYDEFVHSHDVELFIVGSNPSDRIVIIADKIFELNDELKITRTVDLPFNSRNNSFMADITGDGKDEFLVYSEKQSMLAIYSSDLNKLTERSFLTPDTGWKLYPYFSGDHTYKLFLTSGSEGYFLSLEKNKYFLLGYLSYPGIYLFFFLFIVVIKRINTYQLKVKAGLNQRLITLQLQGIKAQLDPHFTFNTLNSVASLIYLEDRQTAYDYMRKFTQLLRSMLNDAERIYRNLEEEVDFVTTYLELEKLRFGEKFNYEIEIGEGISMREQVPKLVLQTFAENAVKHGIAPSVDGGKINISIIKESDYMKITIEDNGIGRERSVGHSTSTGKGLKLTSEFYEILNQINRKPIKHQITDLYSDSLNPSGTRVEVWVPINEFDRQINN